MINLNYILALVIIFIISILIFILFEILDYKFDVKIKYFSLVAKNKLIYYIVLIIWVIILFGLLIISEYVNNNFYFIIPVIYFSIFICLYHRVRSWKMAYNVYIKNVNLLLKAKEKKKRKRFNK